MTGRIGGGPIRFDDIHFGPSHALVSIAVNGKDRSCNLHVMSY